MKLNELNERIQSLKVGERLELEKIDESLYHRSAGIGSTLMKAATKSMAHYKCGLEETNDVSAAAQKAMDIGSAVHCLVLQADLYEREFVKQPAEIKIRNGKKWEEFQQQHIGKTILTETDESQASAMADAILDDAGRFFLGGTPEVSYWIRHETGLILKARIDYRLGDAAIDLKTTKHETPEQFKRAVKYDYDMQEALYRRVTGVADMIFVGVGKSAPYSVFLCRQGQLVREQAEKALDRAIAAITEANEFQSFPRVPAELVETELTAYEIERLSA